MKKWNCSLTSVTWMLLMLGTIAGPLWGTKIELDSHAFLLHNSTISKPGIQLSLPHHIDLIATLILTCLASIGDELDDIVIQFSHNVDFEAFKCCTGTSDVFGFTCTNLNFWVRHTWVVCQWYIDMLKFHLHKFEFLSKTHVGCWWYVDTLKCGWRCLTGPSALFYQLSWRTKLTSWILKKQCLLLGFKSPSPVFLLN